ncbi:uncharacterized protein LOC123498752 [Portunus trituberculatus]|uniref:uncharacterized protein LOC123498752 n=1 Tax=Portunus trituberculatus TaxID=210409 RepID=UPI001E1CFD22|nr:uncharacterized protein LOC123498752 [Portunus trituberculatus]
MNYSNRNSSTPPYQTLSPNTNFYLDTAVEYLASSEGWSGCEEANDNSGYYCDSRFALANPRNVADCQPGDAMHNEETMPNSTSFQAQPVDLLPDQATGYPHETPALLDASSPYCHSLDAANLDWHHQPSSSEECSLDGESREREQFGDTFVPMRQWSPTDGMSQATHGHLAAAVGGTTSTKTSKRGAPHRHTRQFLEGDEKIRRMRDLNNEASQIYRISKKDEKLELQIQNQKLVQENRNLHKDYNALEAHAQWCRRVYGDLQSSLPSMPPAPRPVSPFIPCADHDASTIT